MNSATVAYSPWDTAGEFSAKKEIYRRSDLICRDFDKKPRHVQDKDAFIEHDRVFLPDFHSYAKPHAPVTINDNTCRVFQELVDNWYEETKYLSSTHAIAMNSNYQELIGMGPDVLPLILNEMKKRRGHWFWALKAISRANPVPEEHLGNVRKMTEDWLEWGKSKGLC